MSSITYEDVRRRRPELRLPAWVDLMKNAKSKVRRWSVEKLVAQRSAKLLSREVGTTDLIYFPSNVKII